MAINPSALTGVDEELARRILVTARSIAPCLDSLEDEAGDDTPKPRSDAIAILKGVAKNGGRSHLLKSQRSGSSAAEYNAGSWWSDDDRAGLRSLCNPAPETGAHPVGSFPVAVPLARVWPEGEYS